MRITKTSETPEGLRLKAAQALADAAPADDGDPPVGLIAVASDASEMSEQAWMDAIIGLPIEAGTGFDSFMGSRGVKLTRGLWAQIAPAVPAHLRQGVQAAWIVLDATALISKYKALPTNAGSEKHIALALDATELGLKGLALGNAAVGNATNAAEIADFGVLLQKGRAAMPDDGFAAETDFTFVTPDRLTKDQLPLNGAVKSYLGLLEKALGRKDLVADTFNWIVGDHQPQYFASLTSDDVARIAQNLKAQDRNA